MPSPVTAQLILIQGDSASFQATIDLENHNRVIGRAQNCDIVWGSLQISRKHATLEYMCPKWYIRDSSTNGLSVNGMKLVKGELFPLKDQDIISFIPTGTVRYRFRYIPLPSARNAPAAHPQPQPRAISPQPSTSGAALPSTTTTNGSATSGRNSVELIRDSDEESNHSESLLSLDPPDDYFSFSGDELGGAGSSTGSTGSGSLPSLDVESDNGSVGPSASKRKHNVDSSDNDSDNNSTDHKKKRVQFSPLLDDDESNNSKPDSLCDNSKFKTLRLASKKDFMSEEQINQCNDVEALKVHLRECVTKLKSTEVQLKNVEIARDMDREEFRQKEHDVRSVNAAFKEETYKKVLELMDSELSCSVCNEVFIQATVIDCGHTFCQFCINEWARKKPECPICRKAFRNKSRHIEMENFITRIFESFSAEISTKRKISIKEREDQAKKAVEDARAAAAENQARGGNNFHAFIQSTAERYVDFLAELHQINEILGPRAGGGRGGATSAERRRSARIQDRVIDAVVAGAGAAGQAPVMRPSGRVGRRHRHPVTVDLGNAQGGGGAAAAVPQLNMVRSASARAVPVPNLNPAAPVPVVTLNDTGEDPNPTPPTVRFPQFMNYVRFRRLPNMVNELNVNAVNGGSAN